MKVEYSIDGRVVPEKEFWESYLGGLGAGEVVCEIPDDRFNAMEYGEPLPKTPDTFKLIRSCVKKEMMLSGKELEKEAKRQYEIFTRKHVPYPFIESIDDALDSLTQEIIDENKFRAHIQGVVKSRLKEYNMSGVCTLGLEDYIKLRSKKEAGYGEDEHEAV